MTTLPNLLIVSWVFLYGDLLPGVYMVWVDVEFEVPEDGEVVEVKIGRYHVMEMRYQAEPEAWYPCGGKLVNSKPYPHKIEKWRRKASG